MGKALNVWTEAPIQEPVCPSVFKLHQSQSATSLENEFDNKQSDLQFLKEGEYLPSGLGCGLPCSPPCCDGLQCVDPGFNPVLSGSCGGSSLPSIILTTPDPPSKQKKKFFVTFYHY